MTYPPPRGPNYNPGIQKSGYNAADVKSFPYPQPVADRDINYGWNTKDLDLAQLFERLGNEGVSALHTRSDVDSAAHAQHHTLGTARNQASQGDHIHDGQTSKPIGNGMGLSVSGAKGGNVALANLITMLKQVISFTDSTT